MPGCNTHLLCCQASRLIFRLSWSGRFLPFFWETLAAGVATAGVAAAGVAATGVAAAGVAATGVAAAGVAAAVLQNRRVSTLPPTVL